MTYPQAGDKPFFWVTNGLIYWCIYIYIYIYVCVCVCVYVLFAHGELNSLQ